MSQRDYGKAAVKEARKLDAALRSGQPAPLMPTRTPGRKVGNGDAAAKTLTAAVRAVEAARDEARDAAQVSTDAKAKAEGLLLAAKEEIAAMLDEHAAETGRVVGRGVVLCACMALLELVPLLVLFCLALR